MNTLPKRILPSCLILGLALLSGCASERGSNPQPVESLLYASVWTPNAGNALVVLDCTIDSVIDTIPRTPEFGGSFPCVAVNGRYLSTLPLAPEQPVVWDAATRTPIGHLPAGGIPAFVNGGDWVAEAFLGRAHDSVVFYELPSLRRLFVDTLGLYVLDVPGRSQVVAIDAYGDHTGGAPGELAGKIVVYDYQQRIYIDSIFGADSPYPGIVPVGSSMATSPDGKRLYVLVGKLYGYGLDERRFLFDLGGLDWAYECRVTPDGREVWVTQPGSLDSRIGRHPTSPGQITIVDASSGAIVHTITTDGMGRHGEPLGVMQVCFTVDGTKAYVKCYSGPLLVVDVRTREICKLLFNQGELVEYMDIGPKP